MKLYFSKAVVPLVFKSSAFSCVTEHGVTYEIIEVGDSLLYLDNDKLINVRVDSIIPTEKYVQMFNLDNVSNNYNFFANGILVHNRFVPPVENFENEESKE